MPVLKVLLIPAVVPGFKILRRRPCGSQANAIYTNGVCSHHDKLLAAEDRPHLTEHHYVWMPCISLCFPQGHGGRRLTPAPSLASWLSQENGPDRSLSSTSNPPAPTKWKTFYCPWEDMHAWEAALLCLDPSYQPLSVTSLVSYQCCWGKQKG